jgi:hypothetical protein
MSWLLCGCLLQNQIHPSKLPDYIESEHPYYYVNYNAGEWYELRKPMFLVISTSKALRITRPGYGSPRLDLFLSDEKKREELVRSYRIQRLLPAGTKIRLMSVKFVNGETPFPFFYVDENYQWVEASFRKNFGVDNRITGPEMRRRLGGKKIDPEVEFVWDYDRDWFKKVE